MKGTVATLGVAGGATLKLGEQLDKGQVPSCKHAQVAVHGANPLVVVHGECGSDAHCFLAVARKPLRDSALAKRDKHALFNGPGQKE